MKNAKVFGINALFEVDGYYRLDAILGIEQKRLRSDSDLLVQTIRVSFSQIQPFEHIEQFKFHAMQNSVWDVPLSNSLPLIVSVDLTLLKMMVPGSIWVNGEKIWSPEAKYSLEIDTISTKSTLLSSIAPQFHAQKNSDIKLIESQSAKINGVSSAVVIPAIEIIRYFFASSNSLVSHLFNTPRFTEALIQRCEVDQINKSIRLKMDKTLKKTDAKVMAWAAADEYAKRAMNLINASVVQELVLNPNKGLVYPLTNFPFKGSANLRVDGQFLTATDGKKVFLVTRIKDCDYQHPIKLIELEGMESFSYGSKTKAQNKQKVDVSEQAVPDEKVQLSLDLISHERPGRQKLRGGISNFGDSYSGIKDVQVRLCNEDGMHMPTFKPSSDYVKRQVASKIEQVQCSTLPANYGAEKTVIGLSLKEGYSSGEKHLNDREGKMELVLSVIDSLKDCLPEFNVQFVTNKGVSDVLDFYEFDTTHSVSNWSMIDGKPRKAIFVKLMFREFSVYLLEIERKKYERFALYFLANAIDGNQFNERGFLSRIARASGKNLSRQVFKSHFQICDRVYHSPVDYEDSFKWRIFSKIDEFLALRAA